MKKNIFCAACMAAFLCFNSCSTGGSYGTGTTSDTGAAAGAVLGGILSNDGSGTSVLGSLLDGLLGGRLTQRNLIGTWTYQAPKVAFESENMLAKAGGALVANKIENKLNTYFSKVGIKQGVTTFVFKEDGTYQILTKGKTINTGTYTLNANAKTINMTGMLGLANINCSIGSSGNYVYLMFGADKLLNGASSVAAAIGTGTLSSILGNYDGMKLGFTLGK